MIIFYSCLDYDELLLPGHALCLLVRIDEVISDAVLHSFSSCWLDESSYFCDSYGIGCLCFIHGQFHHSRALWYFLLHAWVLWGHKWHC